MAISDEAANLDKRELAFVEAAHLRTLQAFWISTSSLAVPFAEAESPHILSKLPLAFERSTKGVDGSRHSKHFANGTDVGSLSFLTRLIVRDL